MRDLARSPYKIEDDIRMEERIKEGEKRLLSSLALTCSTFIEEIKYLQNHRLLI